MRLGCSSFPVHFLLVWRYYTSHTQTGGSVLMLLSSARIWSLWDMLELNANAFLFAATQLARLHTIVTNSVTPPDELLVPATVALVVPPIKAFQEEAKKLGARLAVRKA